MQFIALLIIFISFVTFGIAVLGPVFPRLAFFRPSWINTGAQIFVFYLGVSIASLIIFMKMMGLMYPSSDTHKTSEADQMLARAQALSHANDEQQLQALKSNCENLLVTIKKSMQENESNPYEDSKAYLAKAHAEQLQRYKEMCE